MSSAESINVSQKEAASRPVDVGRAGHLAVSSPRVTEHELEIVKEALEHPPQKPDVGATVVSMLSALLFAAKIAHESIKDGKFTADIITLIGFTIAACCAVAMATRVIKARGKKDPLNETALRYLDKVLREAKHVDPPNS